MPYPRVAVVILNWNGKALLEQFLPFLEKSSYPNLELLVVDNGSSDQSVCFLQQQFPQLNTIVLPKNLGYAGGYNTALQQVKADYFILLNSDVEVSPGWIEPMIELLEKHPTAAACQPKLLSFRERDQFEYAGANGGWIDNLGYPFARGRVLEHCEKDLGQYDTAAPVFWASGAAFCIKANIFHEMQGFDASFFAHQEEIDLCWRIQRKGYQIYSCPQSVVWHVGGSTLPKGNSKKTYLNYRNNLWMLAKNLPLGTLCWLLPIRITLDTLAAFKSLLSGDPGYWWAVAKSQYALLERLFSKNTHTDNTDPKTIQLIGRYNGSILWNYYIKGKRTFLEITGSPL
ncbi:MAG: glycosyltransferase family 2 protein [Bacteroidetes bacterium]|nr:glycosyltransferase family 2 protein [Bacteroidota bacterium]